MSVLSGHPAMTALNDQPVNVNRVEKDRRTGKPYTVTIPQPGLIRLFAENLRGCDTT